MSLLRHRSPQGEERRWTLREVVQGKPLGHPSHAMFVHFPVAFWIGALGFDLLSVAGRFPEAPLLATWLLAGGLVGFVPAAVTGLVDWWGMAPGSRKRRVATRHMLFQTAAAALLALDLAMRWAERRGPRAEPAWIALDIAGAALLLAGQWLGGVLVYRMGMRVSTAREAGEEP